MINAVIMASGFGNRMGTDKLILRYKGRHLAEYVMDAVEGCNFYEKIVVTRSDTIINIARSKGFHAIKNTRAYMGQSQSIKLALEYSSRVDGYMFFTADQPFINTETVKLLMHNFMKNNKSIIVPICGHKRGSPVIFPYRFIGELKDLNGDTGGRKIINSHRKDVCFVEVENDLVLMDIDTKEDYSRLLTIRSQL